jgi:hypothetical protein
LQNGAQGISGEETVENCMRKWCGGLIASSVGLKNSIEEKRTEREVGVRPRVLSHRTGRENAFFV